MAYEEWEKLDWKITSKMLEGADMQRRIKAVLDIECGKAKY